MSASIAALLQAWDNQPDQQPLRVVTGLDGRDKLQVRVDLGVLQLEMTGRPDGQRPYGFESILDYHAHRLSDYTARFGSAEGFRLNSLDCEAIRDEAELYYRRYFSLLQLERYREVSVDTARNLRAADFLEAHASSADESWPLSRFRPYIVMMNALARAEMHVDEYDHTAAERVLATAMAAVRHFGARHFGEVTVDQELAALGERLREIQAHRPRSESDRLQRRLAQAIEREDFELAARLRDQLRDLSSSGRGPSD
ncbi:MAG TPA: hypothetical protein DCZ72_01360 [Armatimonadetes bacterium]|nr:hypothetical protein [Armatimonadota bacterium]